MSAMFGHTWAGQYGDEPNGVGGDTWAAALAGITPQQIATGLRATLAIGNDWPPSAPRFRAMCLEVPTLARVANDLRGGKGATPFARLTWQFIDSFRFRQADADKADRMIRDAYELAREHVMAGGALPEEPAALIEKDPEPEHKPANPETARAHLAKMAELLRVNEPDDAEPEVAA